MAGMDGWDIALLAAATYVAVTSLVRLMRHHRNKVLIQWKQKVEGGTIRDRAEKAIRGELHDSNNNAA